MTPKKKKKPECPSGACYWTPKKKVHRHRYNKYNWGHSEKEFRGCLSPKRYCKCGAMKP